MHTCVHMYIHRSQQQCTCTDHSNTYRNATETVERRTQFQFGLPQRVGMWVGTHLPTHLLLSAVHECILAQPLVWTKEEDTFKPSQDETY